MQLNGRQFLSWLYIYNQLWWLLVDYIYIYNSFNDTKKRYGYYFNVRNSTDSSKLFFWF
jgi:hypothetical protein